MIRYEEILNPQQFEVVMSEDGPSLVVAGAGSGKTLTITCRVARLIEKGVVPHSILLLTFTNKAAREMLERASRMSGVDVTLHPFAGTFHHFSAVLLRKEGRKIGVDPHFRILDAEDSVSLLDSCVSEIKKKIARDKLPKGRVIYELMNYIRNKKVSLEEGIFERFEHLARYIEIIDWIWKEYSRKKVEQNFLDFEDLLEKSLALFLEVDEVRDRYSSLFQYVLVDEYQDVNPVQAEIVYQLTKEHRNVMAVGDDCQSIYSFRGADYRNLFNFMKLYPEAKVFKLEYNYRSLYPIVKFSNAFLPYLNLVVKKNMRPVREGGEKPLLIKTSNPYSQAEVVVKEILRLIERGVEPSHIAVLYRNHRNSNEIQMTLSRYGIPFEVRSGLRFQEKAHIKDVLAFLRILANPRDHVSLQRVLLMVEGLGKRYSQKIIRVVNEHGKWEGLIQKLDFLPRKVKDRVEELIEVVMYSREAMNDGIDKAIRFFIKNWYKDYMALNLSNYVERMEDLVELENTAGTYDDLEQFLDAMTLRWEEREENKEGVVLSTIHQAKGLEWNYVFLIYLVEGVLPFYRAVDDDDKLEEEKRLFYVAVTRARERLYLVYPKIINEEPAVPSRFLKVIPIECYTEREE